MNEPEVVEVIAEAKIFRRKLELAKRANIQLIPECFPIGSCKLSSLLFTYHALQKWPSVIIYGVSGIATDNKGNYAISHYWLEYQDTAIDLTADQYNLIEDAELNFEIIENRPFYPVSAGRIGSMQNYKIFKITYRDTYVSGLSELAEDTLHDLYTSYEALEGLHYAHNNAYMDPPTSSEE